MLHGRNLGMLQNADNEMLLANGWGISTRELGIFQKKQVSRKTKRRPQ